MTHLRRRSAFPLTLSPTVSLTLVGTKFQDLKVLETPPPAIRLCTQTLVNV